MQLRSGQDALIPRNILNLLSEYQSGSHGIQIFDILDNKHPVFGMAIQNLNTQLLNDQTDFHQAWNLDT